MLMFLGGLQKNNIFLRNRIRSESLYRFLNRHDKKVNKYVDRLDFAGDALDLVDAGVSIYQAE